MLDYLIIGFGLAGSAFSAVLEAEGKKFVVLDDRQKSASRVAAGICNPVVIKRFRRVWNAPIFLAEAVRHYEALEQKLQLDAFSNIDIYRRIGTVQEQNNWTVAADRDELRPYLAGQIKWDGVAGLAAPYGFGTVRKAGRLKVVDVLDAHRVYLQLQECLSDETFHFADVKSTETGITFKNYHARNIVYATGIRGLEIPALANIPLVPSKGDYLRIVAPELKAEAVINAGHFIIPEGTDTYLVGATYENENNWSNSERAAEAITRKLKRLNFPYRIVGQVSGVRPTVPDRKPLVGMIKGHSRGYLLNGLGSRGVLMAPALAKALYRFIEEGKPLWPEIDVSRYYE